MLSNQYNKKHTIKHSKKNKTHTHIIKPNLKNTVKIQIQYRSKVAQATVIVANKTPGEKVCFEVGFKHWKHWGQPKTCRVHSRVWGPRQ